MMMMGGCSQAAALKAEGRGGIQDQPVRVEPEPDQASDSDSEDGEEEHSGGSTVSILAWSLTFMIGGTLAVSVFSDPMVTVITDFGDNIGIGAFYISFVITPFCSNASELISSLMFASKKRKKNSSLTFSALYGAATMNNTYAQSHQSNPIQSNSLTTISQYVSRHLLLAHLRQGPGVGVLG